MLIGTNYSNYDLYPYQSQRYEADAMPQDSSAATEARITKPDATGSSEKTPSGETNPSVKSADPDKEKKPGRRSSPADCETCKKRKYQDGSDESNVSFKSAAHISPQSAGAAVRAHENELPKIMAKFYRQQSVSTQPFVRSADEAMCRVAPLTL